MDFSSFSHVDYVILAITAVSLLIGFVRGFLYEVLSVVIWVVAYIVAVKVTPLLSPELTTVLTHTMSRNIIIFVSIFVLVLLIGLFVKRFASHRIRKDGFSVFDRFGGGVFGILRGGIICLVLLTIGGHFAVITKNKAWKNSKLMQYFQPYIVMSKESLHAVKLPKKSSPE
jgi:membrane protein required for colicin V production